MAEIIDITKIMKPAAIIAEQLQIPARVKITEVAYYKDNHVVTTSVSSSPYTTAKAIKVLEAEVKKVNPNISWKIPEENKNFFQEINLYQGSLNSVDAYLSAVAETGGVEKLNKFLADKGFSSIKLSPDVSSQTISVASVFDIKVLWSKPGIQTMLYLTETNNSVPAVHLPKVKGYFSSSKHQEVISELETSNKNERFFITKFNKKDIKDSPLFAVKIAEGISNTMKQAKNSNYPNGIIFPMVDYESSSSIEQLKGAEIVSGEKSIFTVAEALAVTRFKLNELGARAQSANVIMALAGAPKTLDIDGPFLAWFQIESGNNKKPVIPFAIYVSEGDMKQPAEL